MLKTKQKRIKLDNGKTLIVDVLCLSNGKHPIEAAAELIRQYPVIKPWGVEN